MVICKRFYWNYIKSVVVPLLLFFFIKNGFAAPTAQPLGLKVPSRYYSPKSIFKKQQGVFCIHGYIPGTTPRLLDNTRLEVEIESLDGLVTIKETVVGEELRPPILLSFDEYIYLLQEEQMRNSWQEYIVRNTTNQEKKRGSGGINLDIPVRIRSKTFQKIFGAGTLGLTVKGDIRMQAGLRREDRSEVRTSIARGANTNFKMQQTQRFTVTGKIGDKVTINVDQDSERAFDFDNNIKLLYQGYDDEILQRLEAGNISLSLPGTRYVTFSAKNSGLFGIKSEMAFGDLNITTIASQEKGQSHKLSLTGGATEGSKNVRDHRYLKNVYFFLDEKFRDQYKNFDADGNHIAGFVAPVLQDSIEVYKAVAGNEFKADAIRGWATPRGIVTSAADTMEQKPGAVASGQFIRLDRGEYTVENNLGFIRMNTPASDYEIIAVAYKTADGQIFGDLNFIRDETQSKLIILKLIKDRTPQPSHATWDLAWKHVYSLGGRNINQEGFDLKIFFDSPSGPDQETDDSGKRWLEIFGLDDKDKDGAQGSPDGEIDFDVNILNLGLGELHFRDLEPFDPEGYFVNGVLVDELPQDRRTPAIYDTTLQSIINAESKFYLQIKTKNRGTDYNLGFNVIEGSEVVTLNNRELVKGRDYTIDYFSGQLTLLNEEATKPTAQLDITYERNQLFQLEKKTILGMRAEYDINKDSFIGSTLLYLSESTLDRKVRVGRGPMKNLVWDVNTRLRFKTNFISKAFDFLPMIRAKGESVLNLEGEIAQVLPTPNTLNSSNTGDNRGVAYIDDFEAAKRTANMGILRKNWTLASEPADQIHTYQNKLNNFIWYNPYDQVFIQDIFPNREINTNTTSNRMHVLTFKLFSDQSAPPDENRWGGVMRALSPGFFDQSQTKFIEIMVQGDRGRLHIDLGAIEEDVIPNNRLDSEDQVVGGFRNGVIDPGEDIGIDGMDLPDPIGLNFPRSNFVGDSVNVIPHDFWDINNNRKKDLDEPWSYDDWVYSEGAPRDYIQEQDRGSIIGTQNNANDEGGRIPDTEDINGNGIVDLANQYFSYSVSLRKDRPDTSLIAGGNPERGWFLYRIPFSSDSVAIGSPSVTQIEYIRIWFDELEEQDVMVSIAEINLVGSEWKELGLTDNEFDVASADTSSISSVAVTQINNHENAEYAASLEDIGVEGEEDRITGVRAREQSLVMKAINLQGKEAGIAQKSFFQRENYIHYDRMRMFVYGLDELFTHIPLDTTSKSYLEYFLRFGADINNFYEYRSTIFDRWNDRNHMDVSLQAFTNFDRTDSTNYDFATDTFVKYLNADSTKSIRVKGRPSLTNVKVLLLGLKNIHPDNKPFTGEIWFNELRLSEVEQEKGMAMRVRGDLKIADFATVNGEIEKTAADFHNVATKFGTGNNRLSSNLNATVKLDKLFPQSWGIVMPLNLSFRNSNSSPKYFPGQDRLVTGDLTDEESARVETRSNQSGFNVSFRRQAKSKNFFIKNTVDKISFSLGRSRRNLRNPTLNFSNAQSWTGNLDYRIDFGRNNYVSLLSWLPNLPLINKIKDTRFYYTPQNISFRLNGAKTDQSSQNRVLNTAQDSVRINETETFNFDRGVRANMKVFESLSLNYSRTNKADMRDARFADFFKGNYNDINIAQTLSARYSPRVFSWLTSNFGFSSNYTFNNNLQQKTTGRNARNSITQNADFTFQWKQLVNTIFGKSPKSSRGRSGSRPRPGQRERPQDDEEKDPGHKQLLIFQQAKDDGKSFNPLRMIGSFFSNFKDISFNYSKRRNNAHFGLADSTKPSFAYQFGFSDTTNIATVNNLSTNNITFGQNETFSANSGIAFGRTVDIGLRFQHSNQRNESTTINGSSSNSWLLFKGYDMPFPEWTVRITGLHKLPLFSKLFKNVTFSHAFTGQKNETWNGTQENITQENFTTNFRPLGKLDLSFKNEFSGTIQMNRARTLSRSLVFGRGARRTTSTDFSITANYSKRSGFKIPIWPFNKAELKNTIDFTFSFSASSSVTEQSRTTGEDEGAFEEQDRTERWTFSPRLTYSFSNQVRGGAFIEIGETKSKRIGNTKIQEFGLDVNIAIRGN